MDSLHGVRFTSPEATQTGQDSAAEVGIGQLRELLCTLLLALPPSRGEGALRSLDAQSHI